MFPLTTSKKLKWLFSLVLIFGGFTLYKTFDVLAGDFAGKEYGWVFKIISEFGLFISVIISVGFFHHWLSAAEEREESLKNLSDVLAKYVDGILLNAIKRGFNGITDKELDFGKIMHGLKPGDYVYWLMTFDPRFKHQCREMEQAVNKGVHFRMLILKADCPVGELRAREVAEFTKDEFNEYAKLFRLSLEDVAHRIDEAAGGSIGVFVSEGLPCIPLFIIFRKSTGTIDVFNSFYLSAPLPVMPYLRWSSEFKNGCQSSFETEHWDFARLYLDYFRKRWELEKEINGVDIEKEQDKVVNFIYAPASAKTLCTKLGIG
ncbi:MAG: hypothetical protein ACU833_02135 [Gammaproteobacteria bacterium]